MATLRKIAGVTRLDGNIAQATLRLYDAATGALRAETTSDAGTGEYEFEDVTGEVMAAGETFFVLADYGSGVRPLAHGPISPVDSEVFITYQALVIQSNPVSYWRLGETSGVSIFDVLSTNTGVISGSYQLGLSGPPGTSGAGISFVHAGVVLDSPGLLPLGGVAGYAVEFLIRLEVGVTPANGYIFGRANTGDIVFNYGGTNKVSFFKNSGTGSSVSSSALVATVPRDNAWHHVVIGWNPAPSKYEAYLDGVIVADYTVVSPPVMSDSLARIGRSTNDASPFIGGLSEMAVYSGFPSADSIAERAALALRL